VMKGFGVSKPKTSNVPNLPTLLRMQKFGKKNDSEAQEYAESHKM